MKPVAQLEKELVKSVNFVFISLFLCCFVMFANAKDDPEQVADETSSQPVVGEGSSEQATQKMALSNPLRNKTPNWWLEKI